MTRRGKKQRDRLAAERASAPIEVRTQPGEAGRLARFGFWLLWGALVGILLYAYFSSTFSVFRSHRPRHFAMVVLIVSAIVWHRKSMTRRGVAWVLIPAAIALWGWIEFPKHKGTFGSVAQNITQIRNACSVVRIDQFDSAGDVQKWFRAREQTYLYLPEVRWLVGSRERKQVRQIAKGHLPELNEELPSVDSVESLDRLWKQIEFVERSGVAISEKCSNLREKLIRQTAQTLLHQPSKIAIGDVQQYNRWRAVQERVQRIAREEKLNVRQNATAWEQWCNSSAHQIIEQTREIEPLDIGKFIETRADRLWIFSRRHHCTDESIYDRVQAGERDFLARSIERLVHEMEQNESPKFEAIQAFHAQSTSLWERFFSANDDLRGREEPPQGFAELVGQFDGREELWRRLGDGLESSIRRLISLDLSNRDVFDHLRQRDQLAKFLSRSLRSRKLERSRSLISYRAIVDDVSLSVVEAYVTILKKLGSDAKRQLRDGNYSIGLEDLREQEATIEDIAKPLRESQLAISIAKFCSDDDSLGRYQKDDHDMIHWYDKFTRARDSLEFLSLVQSQAERE